jgi:hypothetical protein
MLMKAFAQKQNQLQQQSSPNITRSSAKPLAASHAVHPIMDLQRTIGNQAVVRLLHANAEGFKVGSDTCATTRFAYDFSRIPVHSKTPVKLQAKLKVNTPGDSYEQEADRLSEQVMHMPETRLQRACPRDGGCPTGQNEQAGHEHLQTKSVHANDTGEVSAPAIVNEVLQSSGQPLDVATRAFMEPRFGHDFSHVRVHTDAKAAASAHAVNALAYTVGQDVVFGAGEYAPQTTEGRRLLAHELAHTLQQVEPGVLQRAISVMKAASLWPCTFGFLLKASDLTIPCSKIRWEQWISGGLKYQFLDGTFLDAPACNWVHHKDARKAGDWCEDLKGLQEPGPRPIQPEYNAKCGGEPDKVLYTFDDAPGTFHNIGDTIGSKEITSVTFNIGIDHKLWDARYDSKFFEKVFYLRGKRMPGSDITYIDL